MMMDQPKACGDTRATATLPLLPRISVVLPVHNGEPYLDLAIASILGQTFTDLELIWSPVKNAESGRNALILVGLK